jgi:hypothetical protein
MLFKDSDQLEDLKAFLVDWYGGYDSACGVPEQEIPADLPQALRELYAFAGRWKDGSKGHMEKAPEIFQHQDCLYAVERLKREGGRITFLEENQANWTCQVEAGNPQSPVYCDESILWDEKAEGHSLVNASLYHFLKSFCLQEIVFGCRHLYTIEGEVDEPQALFAKSMEEVWVSGYYTGSQDDGLTCSIYRSGNVLVMERYGDYWLGFNDEMPDSLHPDIHSMFRLRQIWT